MIVFLSIFLVVEIACFRFFIFLSSLFRPSISVSVILAFFPKSTTLTVLLSIASCSLRNFLLSVFLRSLMNLADASDDSIMSLRFLTNDAIAVTDSANAF